MAFLIAGGANTSQVLEPNTTGFGTITINGPGILEIGYGTQNATLAYSLTNSIVLAGERFLPMTAPSTSREKLD